MSTLEEIRAALDASGAAEPTLESRVTRLEGIIDLVLSNGLNGGGGQPPADPDAVPGEIVADERDTRRSAGDGGSMLAIAYTLPKPLGFLRVRISADGMRIIWRDPSGEQHTHTFPLG